MHEGADYSGWIETDATVIACEPTLLSRLQPSPFPEGGYEPPTCIVKFAYKDAQGCEHLGRYRVNSPGEIGSSFRLRYLASDPGTNTASDQERSLWAKVAIGLAAAAGVWLIVHFFPNSLT